MTAKLFVLGAIFACTSVTGFCAEPQPPTIQVMSWNVRYDNPRDGVNAWKHRRDWVAEIINKQKADIAGLQEVLPGQLVDLRKRLPEMDVYGVGRDDGRKRGEHVPILFRRKRFELLKKSTFWLSQNPNKPGSRDWGAAITRIASWVQLKDRRSGMVFYVINTHFDHRGTLARAKSAELLTAQLRTRFNDHPVILMGDFNTTPGSIPYKTLTKAKAKQPTFRDAFQVSGKKPQGPSSTWNGFRAIVPHRLCLCDSLDQGVGASHP